MRALLCSICAARHLPAGTRQILAASSFEPAEFQRLTLGTAKNPRQDQRFVEVNGEIDLLSTDCYNCDTCYAEIKPGELCGGWSVWREGDAPEPEWESQYLI